MEDKLKAIKLSRDFTNTYARSNAKLPRLSTYSHLCTYLWDYYCIVFNLVSYTRYIFFVYSRPVVSWVQIFVFIVASDLDPGLAYAYQTSVSRYCIQDFILVVYTICHLLTNAIAIFSRISTQSYTWLIISYNKLK